MPDAIDLCVAGPCDHLTVIDPATERVVEEVPSTTHSQFVAAVQQAITACSAWSSSIDFRRSALLRCADVLRKRTHLFELATLLTQEQGKPRREAVREVISAAHWFSEVAKMDLRSSWQVTTQGDATVHYEPLGVVGAITSWNFPLYLAAAKMAPALLAGNAILIKPAPNTPLATMRMVELLVQPGPDHDAGLPEGIVTVIPGNQVVGKWLVDSDQVDHISFTGSTHVGKQIYRAASEQLKTVTLEMGGNDPAVVLGDVDVEQIVEPLFWGAFTNAGQFCTGIKRLFVHRSCFDQVVHQLAQRAQRTVVGDGRDPRTEMGPLANNAQLRRIAEMIRLARRRGATIVTGGEPLEGQGYFYPPTLVTDVGDDDPIVQEEQFGPVLPILSFDDLDSLIARANATAFGLGASVWSSDVKRAEHVADQLQCGTVWINQHGALDPAVPFGGHGQSGLGVENGWAGIVSLTKMKVIHRRREHEATHN